MRAPNLTIRYNLSGSPLLQELPIEHAINALFDVRNNPTPAAYLIEAVEAVILERYAEKLVLRIREEHWEE
jgi:hypothetical protein